MSNASIIPFDAASVGRHNADLERSCSRVLEGGSWKKQRIVMLVPAARSIDTRVALSWMNLVFPPNNPVVRLAVTGEEVGIAYTRTLGEVLAHPQLSEFEYLLTVEHDNLPPNDGVMRLLHHMEQHPELACIGGLYWTKGEAGVPQIWGDPRDPVLNFRPQVPIPGQLVECCGTGMGFNLWRLSMFKDSRLRKPWFRTQADATGMMTQDLYFWSDARAYGYRCAVDCGTLVGHLDLATGVVW